MRIKECEVGSTVWIQGVVVAPNTVNFGGHREVELLPGRRVTAQNGGGNDCLLRSQVTDLIERRVFNSSGLCSGECCAPLRDRESAVRCAMKSLLDEVGALL